MLGAYLIGLDPCDRAAVNARIEELSYLGLRNGWIESAFLAIAAKERGVPLWKYLGGTGGSVRPYWSTGDTYGHASEAARGVVEAALSHGFSALKLRIRSTDLGTTRAYLGSRREDIARPNLDFAATVVVRTIAHLTYDALVDGAGAMRDAWVEEIAILVLNYLTRA